VIVPCIPDNEKERLAAVKEYQLLDTLPEKDFGSITEIAAIICKVPVSLITLLDEERNFLKAHYGIPINESPRNISFCGHAILEDLEIFIIRDARLDPRFKDNPIVTELKSVFYAGVRLINPDGFAIGTLCVFDTKPRDLGADQKKALIALARQVMNLFEARKRNIYLEKIKDELNIRNEELKNFAGIISHDMKMPLANIILTADILKAKYGTLFDKKGQEYLAYMKQSSFILSDYISGLLEYYESDKVSTHKHDTFQLHHLLEEIVELLNINLNCDINLPQEEIELICNRAALEQILLNLIGNSIKYNDKEKIIIDIECAKIDNQYSFSLTDNGVGIPNDKQNEIFTLFATLGTLDRDGKKGHGIGLSTVKKLVTKLGGEITVDSTEGVSTVFNFSISAG
jgi:hypothetical protein